MQFVETPIFTKAVLEQLSAESYRALQLALALRPEQGNIIQGSGGLRKLRWAGSSRGKRGGLHVIYYWDEEASIIYMLLLYAKNIQDTLRPQQLKILRSLVKGELQ